MIVKTILQVTVFQQADTLEAAKARLAVMPLHELAAEIDEGDMIGEVRTLSTRIVPDDQVNNELVEIGNDSTFFDMEG